MKMATARIVAGVVATFYFHKCQTRACIMSTLLYYIYYFALFKIFFKYLLAGGYFCIKPSPDLRIRFGAP